MSSPGKRRNRIFGCTFANIECHDSESHSISNSSQTNLNATTPNSPSANSSQTSLQERMTLFGFKPSSGQKSFAHSGKRKRAGYILGGNKAPYYVRNTWTHVFVCLSSTTADRIPDAHEKIDLAIFFVVFAHALVAFTRNSKEPRKVS